MVLLALASLASQLRYIRMAPAPQVFRNVSAMAPVGNSASRSEEGSDMARFSKALYVPKVLDGPVE